MLSDAHETGTVESAAVKTEPGFHFGKEGKLKKKSDFDDLKAHGLKWNDSLFTFLVLPASELASTPQCGIICSRRFHKRAVVRNRAKRILREAFRLTRNRFPLCRVLFIPKKKIFSEKMDVVKTHLEALLPWLINSLRDSPKYTSPSHWQEHS